MATYKEVLEASTIYFNGDELAAKVFADKYALADKSGDYKELTPDDMHRRLAKEFSRIEKKYPNPMSEDEIYEMMKNFKYIVPQGSPMSAMGNEYQVQSVSNCFVIGSCADSYGGILKYDEELTQLMKRRAGVGGDISHIRPKGVTTNNAAKTTDGIGIFMVRFSNTCREVAQNGRRGAEMITLNVHHPEIETFINIKRDSTKVTGANISVKLSNEFMRAVKNDTEYEQRWPVNALVPVIRKQVRARDIWDQIILAAWESAEPGLLFWDNAVENTPSDAYTDVGYGSVSTNPCGEIILSEYDSCRLIVVNLFSFVLNAFKDNSKFDWVSFESYVMKAQRLMDDLIDLEVEQIDKILAKIDSDPESDEIKFRERNLWNRIRVACINGRRTGLGPTAVGDALAALGIVYGSPESIKMTEKIYKALACGAYKESIILAKERGSFPVYDYNKEKDHKFVSKIISNLEDEYKQMYAEYGRRNIALTTTAPTGSVSMMTQTSSGIEPVFLLSYMRRKKINPSDKSARVDFVDSLGDKWQEFKVYHHKFKEWMDATGGTEADQSPYHGATSNDVDWASSVELQAAAQRWVCHAISKTCNLPNSATKELVAEVYMRAWESGCKGFTVYRDGCRSGVLMAEPTKKEDIFDEHEAPKRPKALDCDIHQATIKGESWTIFVGKFNGKPYEVFGGLSKFVHIPKKIKHGRMIKATKKPNGSGMYDLVYGSEDEETKLHDVVSIFENPTEGAFTRTLSLALRHGTPIHYMVDQLMKDEKDSDMYSFSKVISRVLKHYIKDGLKANDKTCENCGAENSMIYKEGCKSCVTCGWSKC